MMRVKQDAIASHVAAVNTEGKPCVWVLDSEKMAKLMLWVFWLVCVGCTGWRAGHDRGKRGCREY
ncbi:hypothetical protein GN244_ATG11692 [Phytophthora infestans]|uniref:Uncharacterized protein n=1 Tax=Phytophthora infestans TaxID=4787 RepID=A0A833WIB7_PHYIN|nr:hypothetical protein GN244_ATG11692 [Phytophthora infestans]